MTKFYLYYSTKKSKARPGFDYLPEHPSIQIHFKNPVMRSSFLSKALSFSLTLFWFQLKRQCFWKKWGFLKWTNFSSPCINTIIWVEGCRLPKNCQGFKLKVEWCCHKLQRKHFAQSNYLPMFLVSLAAYMYFLMFWRMMRDRNYPTF